MGLHQGSAISPLLFVIIIDVITEEKNGLKVSRAKTEHLQTTEGTDAVRMKRYMETETVNLPTVQSFKYLGSTIDRRGGASKDVDNRVTKARSK